MKFKIKHEWLTQQPRDDLERYLLVQIDAVQLTHLDLNAMKGDDQDIVHKTATDNSITTVAYALLYLLVNPDYYPKPWILRNRLKAPLEIIEFKEYITDVRNWLGRQAPTNFYGSLVYIQAIQSFLTTMEITTND